MTQDQTAPSPEAPVQENAQPPAPSPAAAPTLRDPDFGDLDTIIFELIISGDEDLALEYVRRGANVNATNDRGVSVLHFAARSTMPNLTRALLENGANVTATLLANDGSDTGVQPIHWAARAGASDRPGSEETIDVLLEFGADINARTTAGTLPVTYANQLGNEGWRQFLISRGSLPE